MISLTGKSAVVCGATSGWGYGAALVLARRGADVVVNARDEDRVREVVAEIESCGGRAIGVAAAVDTMAGARSLLEASIGEFRSVDILVNSTGLTRPARILDMSDADWHAVIDCQLTAVFNCVATFARHMIDRRRGGRVITLGGSAAYRPRFGYAHHAASKGAVVAACLTWAAELAPYGITVNVVRGGVRSRGTGEIEAALIRRAGKVGACPADIGLFEPTEAAEIIAWLASDEAGSYTGLSVGLDGGKLSFWRPAVEKSWLRTSHWSAEEIAEHFNSIREMLPAAEPAQATLNISAGSAG